MKIIWSATAKRNFRKVLDYLYEEWTEKEVLKFQKNVQSLIENISKNNSICPLSKISDLRKCLIDKNNSLVYWSDSQIIYIVTLIDNRSSHQY